jgi:hypothetical protein
VETREEADFVCLHFLERYTWVFVGGAHHAVVCGIEFKLDKVADFGLSHIWDESMTTLCFLVNILSAAMDDDVTGMSLTFATAIVRVIGSLLEVEEAEVEGAVVTVKL